MVDLESSSRVRSENRDEKHSVAVVSMVTVLILGLAKLAVGVLTGSLGLVADAIHSGLDFVSALLTVLAVRWADRPADADHPFGHERAENVAAFVESLLLLGMAVWLAIEAIGRIISGGDDVRPSPLAFAVIVGSIGISYWRSRDMRRAARRHGSEALAVGALDFHMDVWSSTVVLIGLGLASIGRFLPGATVFTTADALAGLFVASIVIVTATSLARETIDTLLDKSPEDIAYRMANAVASVRNVLACERVRARRVGSRYFADVVAIVPRTTPFQASEALTEDIQQAIWNIEAQTDVIVHLKPGIGSAETLVDRIHLIARDLGVRVHDVQVRDVYGGEEVNLHVEVSPTLSLQGAHDLATRLEEHIAATNPNIHVVNTHLETEPPNVERRIHVSQRESALIDQITATANQIIGPSHCHGVRVYRPPGTVDHHDVVLRCSFAPSMPVAKAHLLAEELERGLREKFPTLDSVLVHVEPEDKEAAEGT